MKTIFVFGSNLSGIHGAGSAKYAADNHGAIWGIGVGLTGNSYAIPTKDCRIQTIPLLVIKKYVTQFLEFAQLQPDWTFNIVAIGCGLAGYQPEDIAPMFANAPKNCVLPKEFVK